MSVGRWLLATVGGILVGYGAFLAYGRWLEPTRDRQVGVEVVKQLLTGRRVDWNQPIVLQLYDYGCPGCVRQDGPIWDLLKGDPLLQRFVIPVPNAKSEWAVAMAEELLGSEEAGNPEAVHRALVERVRRGDFASYRPVRLDRTGIWRKTRQILDGIAVRHVPAYILFERSRPAVLTFRVERVLDWHASLNREKGGLDRSHVGSRLPLPDLLESFSNPSRDELERLRILDAAVVRRNWDYVAGLLERGVAPSPDFYSIGLTELIAEGQQKLAEQWLAKLRSSPIEAEALFAAAELDNPRLLRAIAARADLRELARHLPKAHGPTSPASHGPGIQRAPERVTALHVAAKADLPENVRVLLELGAEPSARSSRGRTPAQLAGPRSRALLQSKKVRP